MRSKKTTALILRRDGIDHFVPAVGVADLKLLLAVLVIPRPHILINGSTMMTFTVQRMLIRQNAVFSAGTCCIVYASNMIMS